MNTGDRYEWDFTYGGHRFIGSADFIAECFHAMGVQAAVAGFKLPRCILENSVVRIPALPGWTTKPEHKDAE